MLFSDRKNLLSLYNAVNQSDYNNPDDLEIVTLENAIYMGMKNDLAFIMDTNLYLYEHQSTYNPNMPLRDLFYICSEYQKLVDKKSLYSSTLQKFLRRILLSFIMVQRYCLTALNLSFLQHLKEYAQYVARVRHYAANMSLNQAVECAVDECIKEGFLQNFFPKSCGGYQYEYF